MRWRKVHQIYLIIVKVNLHTVIKGQHRQGCFGIGLLLVLGDDQIYQSALRHIGPSITVCDNRCSLGAQRVIAFGMIEVPMGVDGVINAVATDFTNRCFDLFHHLRKLIVYDQHTVTADGNAYVSAHTKEDVQAVSHFF